MNIPKSDKEHLYRELYNMKGFGVSDYLNDWWDGTHRPDPEIYNGELEIKPSLHGWKIFIFGDRYEYGTAHVFNRWDKWRVEVDYYFNGYMRTVQQEPESVPNLNCIENIKEKFVWHISRIVKIHDTLEENGITLNDPYPEDCLLFM